MQFRTDINYLTIPGLASSGPRHWQTIWEKQSPAVFTRVEQDNWDLPNRAEWVDRLNRYISNLKQPTLLVAHSLGCLTVAHWAQKFYSPFVKGALLVAPADAELSERLSFVEGFSPIPNTNLPFETLVVASTNDIYASIERSAYFARQWGSAFINLGAKGHINASSGFGEWADGKAILHDFTSRLTKPAEVAYL
ncbi:alpha/beta hydrolase [Emticicia sp. TH156]|uniref:RBBP9/YdeN family alpha/beta hydrolase n=1 Tax=Emticicia sp. TH156 TaxID=2067454 RepID=UPI000C76A094|nr:alpha/beta hydrolase [Emticicia sp. TH156]PLK42863.1 alpha/beta hydrolase [Emticicia sp. TH156]